MELKLLLCFIAVWGWRGAAAQCDSNPCEQECIPYGSGHICDCWPNYELQADGVTCKNEKDVATSELYEGCYAEDTLSTEVRDFQTRVWTRTDATINECIRTCRARAFRYAALQSGNECWCDDSFQRLYDVSADCLTPCTGTSTELCGGTGAISVYRVPHDQRYMGCWNEDVNAREMSVFRFGKEDARPPYACVDDCSVAGYSFAAVFNGGDCYCGNAYGSFGAANEEFCTVPCTLGYSDANCGGNSTNAIYSVLRVTKPVLSSLEAPEEFGTIYFKDLLYDYPHEMGVVTQRLIVYASDVINIKSEDTDCSVSNCYLTCGTIPPPDGYDQLNEVDMDIRDWHIKISEVMDKYINSKTYVPTRVHIYAQTLVIDASVNWPFSAYIRARQIIVDYSVNPSVTFDHTGPELSVNITQAAIYGTAPDLAFMKTSVLCARMMINENDVESKSKGIMIIDDIIRDRSYQIMSSEQKLYVDNLRSIRAQLTSIDFVGLYWVPYYSKSYYTTQLDNYAAEITYYANEYDSMMAAYDNCQTFVGHSEVLIDIWITNVLVRSEILYLDAQDSLAVSEAVYKEMYTEYNESRQEAYVAGENFKAGIEEVIDDLIKKAMRGLVSSCFKLAFGIVPCRSGGLKDAIEDVSGVIDDLQRLEVVMEDLTALMKELEEFLLIADEIQANKDYDRYMDNVEAVAALYPMIIEWDNFKYMIESIFEEPDFVNIPGAVEFEWAMIDLCNWGQALTKSTTEYAGMVREFVKYEALYNADQEMAARLDEYLSQVGANCENKGRLAKAFYEQHYDMMLFANDVLIQFCNALFYETLGDCPETAEPKFDADLRELVQHIERAADEAGRIGRISSGSVEIDIVDQAGAPADCSDPTICPIKVFRDTGKFIYTLPIDLGDLQGIDLFLINQIFIQFPGITPVGSDVVFQVEVSKDGSFKNRLRGTYYEFYSRGLSAMTYGYDVTTGVTRFACNLLNPSGDATLVQQASPFTTWSIKVDPVSVDKFDTSNVNAANFTLEGSFDNSMRLKMLHR